MSAHGKPGHSEQAKGSVKEAIGKLIGDGKVEAEGKAQQRPPKSGTKPGTIPKA